MVGSSGAGGSSSSRPGVKGMVDSPEGHAANGSSLHCSCHRCPQRRRRWKWLPPRTSAQSRSKCTRISYRAPHHAHPRSCEKGRDERRENAGGAGRATRGVEAWPPPVSATSSRTPGVAAPTPLPLALSRAVRSPRDGCCSAPARVSRTNSPAPPLSSVLRSSFSRHPLVSSIRTRTGLARSLSPRQDEGSHGYCDSDDHRCGRPFLAERCTLARTGGGTFVAVQS